MRNYLLSKLGRQKHYERVLVLFPSVKSMGKSASMDREGRQEAGIFPLNILEVEKLFSKIMKKFKSK